MHIHIIINAVIIDLWHFAYSFTYFYAVFVFVTVCLHNCYFATAHIVLFDCVISILFFFSFFCILVMFADAHKYQKMYPLHLPCPTLDLVA